MDTNDLYNNADLVITFIFLADIVVAFNTGYIDVSGEDVRERRRIARRYICGDFVIDLLSSIPYKPLGKYIPFFETISFLKILKVVRIKRITKLVLKLEFREEQKAVSHPTHFTG